MVASNGCKIDDCRCARLKARIRSTGCIEWYGMELHGIVWSGGCMVWYDMDKSGMVCSKGGIHGSSRIKSDNQPKQVGQTTFFWGFLTVR